MKPALVVALAALIAAPARAQAPAAPLEDPDAHVVEELVVTAIYPGPAWWRVSDADTTVWVLGVPSVMPKGLAWDRTALERRLTGASTVILPFNQVSVNLLQVPGAAIDILRLRSRTPYEERLSGPLKARFVAARAKAGQPAKRYGTTSGLAAALLLVGDYRSKVSLTSADPAKTIARLAKARKLKTEARSYSLGPLLGQVIRTPKAAQLACLDDALDEIEAGTGGTRRAAQAWAAGDVRGALGAERGYEKCLISAPGAVAFDARLKADAAATIARALKKPGHAVAVVQLRPLLAQGGVLDRLKGQGFEVKTPGERDEEAE